MRLQLQIFAKAPLAGAVKTRLIPALGAAGAAQLQQKMTTYMVAEAVAAESGPVALYCAPDCSHHSFVALHQQHPITLKPQQGTDIGERMSLAIEMGLQQFDGVILMGSDCPQIDRKLLQQVAAALLSHEVVMVPAEDGGYMLVAMRRALSALFKDITWSSETVMTQSAAILDRHKVAWKQFPPLVDIDRPEDLQILSGEWFDE